MDKTPDKAAYDQEINAFYENVLKLLSARPTSASPEKPPTLYPPDQPPDLMVFLGDPDPVQIAQVRAQLPPAAFLLWLHPPCDPTMLRDTNASVPAGQRTILCSVEDDSLYCDKISLLVTILPEKQVRFVVGQGYAETHSSTANMIENSIKQAIENSVSDMTRGLTRLRCSFHNIPGIIRNSGNRPAKPAYHVPVVICGAGPSLETQLGLLKTIADRTLIIAVGHAAPSMLKAGITPDIVAESDSQAYRNWPDDIKHMESVLLANTEVSPEVAARFDKILWCAGSSPPFNALMQKWGVPLFETQLARTVTISALDFAIRMGLAPIALVGQDLCVTESGRTHSGETGTANKRELIEIQGNDGKTVRTTQGFSMLRDSMQDYLHRIHAANTTTKHEIFNCTEGGALIQGTTRDTLENFSARLPEKLEKPAMLENTGAITDITPNLQAFSASAKKYRNTAENIVKCCADLKSELAQRQLKMARVRTRQHQLQQLMGMETSLRQSNDIAPVINPIIQYVDHIMKETPGMVSDATDPSVQLTFLRARFSFARDICDDLLADLKHVSNSAGTGFPHPHIFSSFKNYALGIINNTNPELAAALGNLRPGAIPENFKIAWINQVLPFVEKKGDDGAMYPLSTFFTMHDEAVGDLDAFFAPAGFNEKTQAVVFIAPGNWIHPFTFAGKHPQARMMVVDPWPELLGAMIERGCFLHKMPKDTLIAAPHPKTPRWRSLCSNKIVEWKKDGLEIKIFTPHATKVFSEAVSLLETMNAMGIQC